MSVAALVRQLSRGFDEFASGRRRILKAGGGHQVKIDEDRIHKRGHREHVAVAVQADDRCNLAGVKARPLHEAVHWRDGTLLCEIVHPGSVQPDDVAQRARCSANHNLVTCAGVGAAHQRDGDTGVFCLELVHDPAQCTCGKFRLPPLNEFQIRICLRGGDP